ncbi:DEAD/DEAH box helicase [Ornithinimicrobium cavernae]|uniref:DEAD/DEAH box helicase n=1 Tax=Ornithinimicrobium cavernae TaxID=2666047 RepID=UPI000D6957F7|nr:DEAD/DEAH box helicase [Ornithinimicrobium cavernae]
MYAVHALWSPGRGLCLWAEDADRAVTSRSQAVRRARPHPFAVPSEELAAIHPGTPGSALLLLPSLLTAPLDSPELVRTRPRRRSTRQRVLAAWSVPVVTLGPAAALALLEDPGQEARYGATVQHLTELAATARDLVERGRVLPSVQDGPHGPAARWRPVLQGPDVPGAQALVDALPPVGRAETTSAEDHTGQHPGELVSDALEALVDAAARERLATAGVSLLDALPRRRGRPPRQVPAAEAWLPALSSPEGLFEADPTDVAALRESLEPWDALGREQSGPARLVLRLSEPDPGQPSRDQANPDPTDPDQQSGPEPGGGSADSWRLDFLLQSVQDPSLVVPADQVWQSGTGLQRWLERPEELMLGELGRASTLYPPLGTALRDARPAGMTLTADTAYDFLAHQAGLLDQAGFVVQLPSWWTRRRRLGLRGSATPAPDGGVAEGMFSRESLSAFSWQLAIGDDPLTEEELAALAAAKAPLVRLRGEWLAADPEQIRRGLEFLSTQGRDGSALTAAEVLALASSHPDDLDTPLPVVGVHATGLLGDLLSGVADQHLAPVAPPDTLRAELRGYQQRGLSWLAFLADLGLGACLADDMGLGKTLQLLALEALQRYRHPETGPTLLLCPMSLVGNWQREAARFAPELRVHAHHGPGRLHGAALDAQLTQVDLVVTTYQTAVRDIDELAERQWARVVLDEAQAIKNARSRAARAVRRMRADHRVALTGTPVENRLAELWSLMDFLNPGILGTPELFRSRYAKPIERYGQTEPAERLRAVTRPYVLRRLKTDRTIIDDLPDKIEIKQYCNLTAEQASLYQAVVEEMMPKIEESEGIERRGNVLAAMTKLKQVCNHPAQFLHGAWHAGHRSGKVLRLEEILEEVLAEGDKALLFTQYAGFADLLLPHLSARFGQDVLYLHGGTPRARREEMVQSFQSPDGPPLFLLSLKAGGTGLNLTEASHVIHLDRWWNPAVENQATDRAFRIGQRRNVQVRKFICTGTLEERIDQMMEQKQALADLVVGDGEGWLTELSTQELRQVLELSPEAVGE